MKGFKLSILALAVAIICVLPGALSAKGPKFSFNLNLDTFMPPPVVEQPVYVPAPVYPALPYYYDGYYAKPYYATPYYGSPYYGWIY